MRKVIYILTILIGISSCSKDNEVSTTNSFALPPVKERVDTTLEAKQSKYLYDTIFGCGYDVTEDLFGDNLFKRKVIDFAKFDAYPEANWGRLGAHSARSVYVCRGSYKEIILDIVEREFISTSFELQDDYIPFMKTFIDTYEWNNKYVSYRARYNSYYRYDLMWSRDMFKGYLTTEFEKDLELLPAKRIIEKYGTHVPLTFVTGTCIKFLLASDFDGGDGGDDYIDMISAGSFYKSSPFKASMSYESHYPKSIDKYDRFSKDEFVRIKSLGGEKCISENLYVDKLNLLTEYDWMSDLNEMSFNSVILVRGWNCPALYHFVYDNETKKDEIKEAIQQYIAESNK